MREGKFTVHGTTRQRLAPSPGITWHRLDVADESSVAQLAADLDRLDLVINTAGVLSSERFSPEKSVRQASADQFLDQMRTNAMPLLLLGKHLGPLLKKSDHAHFITLSARVGSISDNHLGGWFSYRASKAALNMLVRTLAIEWQRTLPNTCLAAYHPGTVDTDCRSLLFTNLQPPRAGSLGLVRFCPPRQPQRTFSHSSLNSRPNTPERSGIGAMTKSAGKALRSRTT